MDHYDIRFFSPRNVDDLRYTAIPYIHTWVTVKSWHENIAMKEKYPHDKLVGFVEEFGLDVPESELLVQP